MKLRLFKRGIFARTFILLMTMSVLTIIPFGFLIVTGEKTALLKSMESQARSLSLSISEDNAKAFVAGDSDFVVDHNMQAITGNPDILYIVIARHDGMSLIHTHGKWEQREKPDPEWNISKSYPAGKILFSKIAGRKVYHYSYPLQVSGIDRGMLHIGLSASVFEGRIGIMYRDIFVLSMICFIFSIALSYVFTNQLTYPIISLRETTDRIMHGDLTARADITTGDEVEELAASFNKMAEGIMQARDALERRVEERTSELKKAYEKLLQEVTERKRLEEELLKSQKLESIGILAGGIAHDFNNILTAILTYITLANMDASPGTKLSKRLSEAEKATLRASDLTRQLLTFSKGGQPVMTSVVLNQLIRDSADFVLRGSNVKSEYIIAEDLWPVEADEGQISQVINNLAINAGQAMPEGGIVEISAKNMTVNEESGLPLKEGKYVNISIKDHGHGIPEEILPKIFDPYFTTKQIGSGLGLAVTYSIIKNHNGHIAVTSKAGSETTFDIYLPASDKQCLTDVSKDEKIETGSGRILIMDDQEMIRDAAGEILKNLGYEVETCIDGAEAVELFRQAKESGHPFDAVIMDLTVPGGMGGMEAMEKLIELDPEVRAIVSSGYSNDPVMSNFREYGFREVIVKPYKISEVSKKLRRVLSVQL